MSVILVFTFSQPAHRALPPNLPPMYLSSPGVSLRSCRKARPRPGLILKQAAIVEQGRRRVKWNKS